MREDKNVSYFFVGTSGDKEVKQILMRVDNSLVYSQEYGYAGTSRNFTLNFVTGMITYDDEVQYLPSSNKKADEYSPEEKEAIKILG